VVPATSDYPLLAVYSVKRTNGALTLLVINKSSSSNLTATINLAGYLPFTNATVYSYGIPQDTAARTGVGSPDIAQSSLTGVQSSFSATFAPFSVTVIVMSAGSQPPFAPANLAAVAGDGNVALSWSASATATNYYIKRSLTTGNGYTTIATNASVAFTNTGLNNGTLYYFVVSAANASGESGNSTEAGARPTSFAPTQLGFVTAGTQLQLNWPADHTGWQLQSQTNSLTAGLGTNWVNVSSSAQTNQVTVPLNAANGAVFFRLVRP
jgi:hypothetical protein